MKMKCENCGKVFDESEMKTTRELVGEYHGHPAYENYGTCPECGSDDISDLNDSKSDEELQEDCFNNDITLDFEYCTDCIHKSGCFVYFDRVKS